jgi:hypothetical protein
LHVADIDFHTSASRLALIENITQRSGNKTSILVAAGASGHGEGLTRSGLTIREDSPIETIQSRVYHVFGNFIENLFLPCLHSEDLIESERPFLFFVIDVPIFSLLWDEKVSAGLLFVNV